MTIGLKHTAIRPNEGFMRQLQIFYQTSFKVSKKDKETRMFYLERVVNEVMSESIVFLALLLSKIASASRHCICCTCAKSVSSDKFRVLHSCSLAVELY